MPNQSDHIAKANHNERFFRSFDLTLTPYLDWVVTGVFYATLHYIDTFLATEGEGIHPGSHHSRDRYIRTSLRPMWSNYRALKDESRAARYDPTAFTETIVRNDIIPKYETIKNYIQGTLP